MSVEPTTTEGRAELRALAANATPRPWFNVPVQGVVDRTYVPLSNHRDRELIVAAVNALPKLLDRLDELEARCGNEK